MGASVALDRLDTTGMIASIERMFAADPRLEGFLPPSATSGSSALRGGGPGPAAQLPGTGHPALGDQPEGEQGPVAVHRRTGAAAPQEPYARADVRYGSPARSATPKYAGDIEVAGAQPLRRRQQPPERAEQFPVGRLVGDRPGADRPRRPDGLGRRDRNHISSRRKQAGPTTLAATSSPTAPRTRVSSRRR
ncbi:hypothetical protein LV779_37075 [Streptomyces thinghirensis]|nr:hypothetical protein [Streptomyces thinghirensis]